MIIDVRHIAKLAKLHLKEEDVPHLERQMQDIVSMVENLPEIDEDLAGPDRQNAMVLRADEIKPSLSREELISNAPKKQAGCFVVPKTV